MINQTASSVVKSHTNAIWIVLIIILFIFLFFIRFYNLAADPPPWQRTGSVLDEGGWIGGPRNGVLYGQWVFDDQNQWTGSPIFTYLSFISFKLFGVGFISARLISAVMGSLTLILVYWIMLRTYGIKMACLTLAILGLNETFLIYHRLAIIEAMIGFFLVLSFMLWYLGQKNRIFYFLCGIAIAGSLIAKSVNIIYYTALAVIWLWEYKDKLKAKKFKDAIVPVLLVGLGMVVVAVPFILCVYLPNIGVFKGNYDLFIHYGFQFSGIKGLLRMWSIGFSQSFAEELFTQLPAALSIILIIIYIMTILSKKGISVGNILSSLKPPMFYSLVFSIVAWIVFLPIEFLDRRQVAFLIPWSILTSRIAYALLTKEEFPLWRSRQNTVSGPQFAIVLGLFAYSLWALIHVIWRKFEIVTISYPKAIIFMIEAGMIGLLTLWMWYRGRENPRARERIVQWSSWTVLIILVLLPLLVSIKRISEVLFGMAVFEEPPSYRIIFIGLFAAAIITFFFPLINRQMNVLGRKFICVYLSIFFGFNILAIVISVFTPSHSMYLESKRLGNIIPFGAIVEGATAQQLCFENGFYPFAKHPISATEFNNDRGDAGYYIVQRQTEFIGEVDPAENIHLLKGNEKYLTTVKMWPYPFAKDHYRMVLDVYEVPGKTENRVQTSHYHSKYQ